MGDWEALADAAEAATDALLELELDPTRELLEQSALTGATAVRWAAASAALQGAWAAQTELAAAIEQARALRGKRRREALERSVPDHLLAQVRAGGEEARACLTDVAGAWEACVPRLKRASAVLEGSERRELARLTAVIAADPLGAPVADLDALDAAVAFRVDAPARLAAARARLDELQAVTEAARAAHAAVTEKIAGPDVPAPLTLPAELAERLDDLATSVALEQWSADADALLGEQQRILAANRAPIAERDQLRGLLGAYQAKAHAVGALEDRGLSERFDHARRALYTAPTDLCEAARLVQDYRRALTAPEVSR
jgi:hypothetical protein